MLPSAIVYCICWLLSAFGTVLQTIGQNDGAAVPEGGEVLRLINQVRLVAGIVNFRCQFTDVCSISGVVGLAGCSRTGKLRGSVGVL